MGDPSKEPTFWRTWLPTLDLAPHEVESFFVSAGRAAWHQAEGIHDITTDEPGKLITRLRRAAFA